MKSRFLPFLVLLFLPLATSAGADTVFPISTSAQLETLIGSGSGAVPDGGVIEMAAGTYLAPNDGFLILNPGRSFTIRAATAGTVILDGAGSERIFRFIVSNAALGGAVVFEGLTFRDGFSTSSTFASAMTLQDADATFIDCLFEDNVNQASGSGSGTLGVQTGATAFLLRTILQDNTSRTSGAGAVVVVDSTMWCHECQFLRNRNNVPGHSTTATGAGFVVTDESTVYLSNSRFEANEAGFAGGAFDVKGSFADPIPAQVVATNSTFIDNIAAPDPAVATSSPAAGGVANVEDNAAASFYNSRLVDNTAQFGGAIAVYRATLEVHDSVLRGNFATGRASSNSAPRGGAIFAVSDDTAVDGVNNRPTSQVTIRDSLFDGQVTSARRGTQTAAAQTGGCVYTTGDVFRFLGQGGVPQGGTQAENSASLDIAGTAFFDCDVENLILDGPFGGAVYSALAVVTIDDSLIADSDSSGTSGAGGAVALLRYADATLTDTTFANNSSERRGGAMFMLGATIDIDGCTFMKNTVQPIAPGVAGSLGGALYTGPQDGAQGIDGVVQNSLFVANNGLTIYDDDRNDGGGLYNLVTYVNNQFFDNEFSPNVYRNSIMGGVGVGIVDPAGLNAMIVNRGGGNTTDKAPFNDNEALATEPVAGKLLALPPQIIDQVAAGDPESSTESFLAYAWCGACAELDGSGLLTATRLVTADTGVHSLMVFDNAACSGAPDLDLTATLDQGATPSATLTADPIMIMGGGSSNLTWDSTGTFLESALDQREGVLGTASGSTSVSPPLTTNYTFFVINEEGGASAQRKIYVDEEPDELPIFDDGFESGDTTAWSSTQG